MVCKYAEGEFPSGLVCRHLLLPYGRRPSHGCCRRCQYNTDPGYSQAKIDAMLAREKASVNALSAPRTLSGGENVVSAVPRDQWPLAAKGMALLRTPEDRGVGDTVARLARIAGGESLAAAYRRITGRDCHCAQRAERLNQMFPYGQ